MTLAATLEFQEGCTNLSFDGTNAPNSIYRHGMLPALAEVVPGAADSVVNIHAREPPNLLFAMDGRAGRPKSSRPLAACNRAAT